MNMGGHRRYKGGRGEPAAAAANVGLTVTGSNDLTSPVSGRGGVCHIVLLVLLLESNSASVASQILPFFYESGYYLKT